MNILARACVSLSLGLAALLPLHALAQEAPKTETPAATTEPPKDDKQKAQDELKQASDKQKADFEKDFGKWDYNNDTKVDINAEMRQKFGMPVKAQNGQDYVAVTPIKDAQGNYVGGAQGWTRDPNTGQLVAEPMTLIVPAGALAELNKANAASAAQTVAEKTGEGLIAKGNGDAAASRTAPDPNGTTGRGDQPPSGATPTMSTTELTPEQKAAVARAAQGADPGTGTNPDKGAPPNAGGIKNPPPAAGSGTTSTPGSANSQGGPPVAGSGSPVAGKALTDQASLDRIIDANDKFHRAQAANGYRAYVPQDPNSTVARAPDNLAKSKGFQWLNDLVQNAATALKGGDDHSGFYGGLGIDTKQDTAIRTAWTTRSSDELPADPSGNGVRREFFGQKVRVLGEPHVEKN